MIDKLTRKEEDLIKKIRYEKKKKQESKKFGRINIEKPRKKKIHTLWW